MKKTWKVLIIIFSIIIGIYAIIAFSISPIAHNYIEKHSKELCGRVVTMDQLRLNVLTGRARIIGLKALETNEIDTFISIDTLKVNMNLFRLFASELRFQEITLVSPVINVWQRGSTFNFDDLMTFFMSNEAEETVSDTTESPLAIDIRNITLKRGNFIYKDLEVNSKFDLLDLSLIIPQLYFSGEKTNIGVNLNFGKGGDLTLNLLYALDKSTYNLHAILNNFSLESVYPYLRQSLNINNFQGLLSANIVVSGDVNHIMDIETHGTIHIADIQMFDLKDETLVSANSFDVSMKKIDLKENVFLFDTVALSGLQFYYKTLADSTNTISDLMAIEETVSEEVVDTSNITVTDTIPINFNIAHFLMKESDITYSDFSLKKVLNFKVSSIQINADNLSMNENGTINLSAILGDGGALECAWKGNISDLTNHKIFLKIRNFKLKDLSPYCVHYTAYPIKEGLLSFTSETTIKNNILNSINDLDIYKCFVDDKLKEINPEFKIPLKAGLYLLTDREDKIKIELPVNGNIEDPNFSFKKIIFKTLGNLIIKVVASPVDFVAKSFGVDKEIFGDLELLPTDTDINSENFDPLNKISEIIKAKNGLILTLQQSIDTLPTLKNLALFHAKRDFFFKNNPKPDDERLILEDINHIFAIKDNNSELIAFIDKKSDSIINGSTSEKAFALYDRSILENDLKKVTLRRNEMLIHYFKNQGVAEENIAILPNGDKHPPLGKIFVTFGMKVSETEGGENDNVVYEEFK